MKPKIIIPAWGDQHDAREEAAVSCDGDCACALPTSYRAQNFLVNEIPATWQPAGIHQIDQITTLPLTDGYWMITSPGASAGWAVINESAREVFHFFAFHQNSTDGSIDSSISVEDFQTAAYTFYQAGFLTESRPALRAFDKTSTKAPLEAWLFLTRACNMACPHCFVSKDSRQMTLETGLQAVERLFLLAEKHQHPGVKIKYAGGEPTLRWDLVTALHERAAALAQQTGLPLTEILVTNGAALSQSRLEYIKTSNIQLSISLDGFGEGHDRQRPFVNGQPSFARIYKNIKMALAIGLRPYLTITLTRLNLDDLPTLTAFALQNRLFLNWNFYRPHQANDPLTADHSALVDALQKAFAVINRNMPDYPFFDKLIDRSNFSAAHEHTCGAGLHYLSIDYDGKALPCHMLSGANQSGIPLNMLTQVRFDGFSNKSIDEREGCNTCEWRYWCTGGCPILAGTPNYQGQSKSPYCEVYKAIYPELMKLKGYQILSLQA